MLRPGSDGTSSVAKAKCDLLLAVVVVGESINLLVRGAVTKYLLKNFDHGRVAGTDVVGRPGIKPFARLGDLSLDVGRRGPKPRCHVRQGTSPAWSVSRVGP